MLRHADGTPLAPLVDAILVLGDVAQAVAVDAPVPEVGVQVPVLPGVLVPVQRVGVQPNVVPAVTFAGWAGLIAFRDRSYRGEVQVQVLFAHGFLLDLLWRVGYNPSAPPSSSG